MAIRQPIGALNEERLQEFRARYQEMKAMQSSTIDPDDIFTDAPFMYGCHYSTPGYVVYYTVRKDPQLMLRLQNGRYDTSDRLLCSIEESWNSKALNQTILLLLSSLLLFLLYMCIYMCVCFGEIECSRCEYAPH